MSSIFIESAAREIKSLIEELGSLGITAKHPKELAVVAVELDAFHDLRRLHDRAASFVATKVDGADLEARLAAAAAAVPDADLIEYAARATAAGSVIGVAAQELIAKAEATRIRNARDVLRRIFPKVIEDLRTALAATEDKPNDALINSLRSALVSIDKLAGKGVCDYWCIRSYRSGKWSILERDLAEELELANGDWIAEQQRKARERDTTTSEFRISAKPKVRNLRRVPMGSSGFGGAPLTAADLDSYVANKSAPTLTR